ncbi:hypothetical protein Tco_1493916 [Tanacetum coccineum]
MAFHIHRQLDFVHFPPFHCHSEHDRCTFVNGFFSSVVYKFRVDRVRGVELVVYESVSKSWRCMHRGAQSYVARFEFHHGYRVSGLGLNLGETVWSDLIPSKPVVPWYKCVRFSQNIPRHSFILWLAVNTWRSAHNVRT